MAISVPLGPDATVETSALCCWLASAVADQVSGAAYTAPTHDYLWAPCLSGVKCFVPCCRLAIAFSNRIWGNETVMNYLKTGTFHHWLPIGRACHWEDPAGQPGCDFFGLNHYSR